VTARVEDELVADAQRILNKSVDIEQRRSDFQASGWSRFNADEDNYTPEQVAEDRARSARRL
jgi:hypothetical protein